MNISQKILVLCISSLIFLAPTIAKAASAWEELALGGAAFAYINAQLNNINDNKQDGVLKQTQDQTGVYQNDQTTAYVNAVAHRLMNNGLIKHQYAVYVTPSKDFNAFCTLGHVIAVNKGAVDALDEDEFAAVLGHEMGHGEHKDPVEGIKKIIGLSVIVDLYIQNNPNLTSEILGGATTNYIANEVITMKEEWQADDAGFDNAVAAGYNPGGGAAAMFKLRAKLGELWHEGLSQVISPNNHPKTSDRIANFAKHLTDYSGGHITVNQNAIVAIDGKDIVAPVKAHRHLAGERAYLVAGNLARVYHANALGRAYVGSDGAVYIGDQVIMYPAEDDTAASVVADKINAAIGK
jgi:predicted Zn-dependent protease